MKVIGINTSPREESNVRIALETALEEAKAKGAETEIFDVNGLTITPCQGDNYCKAHAGKCAIDDDMQKIYAAIEEADGIILASPIYFGDINGPAKVVIDRLYAYFMSEEHQKLFADKKVSFMVTHGAAPREAFEAVVNGKLQAFGMLGFKPVDLVNFDDNNVPGAISQKEDQLASAKKVGENII